MLITASVVAGDASAFMTTRVANKSDINNSNLLMQDLIGGNMGVHSTCSCEHDIACALYCIHTYMYQYRYSNSYIADSMILSTHSVF